MATEAGSMLVTGGARQGLAAHKVLVYARYFFYECTYLLLKGKTCRSGGQKLFCCGFLVLFFCLVGFVFLNKSFI